MKLYIDRKHWNRGSDNGMLRKPSGQKCCLGFLASQCGIREITSVCSFHDLTEEQLKLLPPMLRMRSSASIELHDSLTKINDTSEQDEIPFRGKAREAELRRLFKKAGITAIFRG